MFKIKNINKNVELSFLTDGNGGKSKSFTIQCRGKRFRLNLRKSMRRNKEYKKIINITKLLKKSKSELSKPTNL